MDARGENPPTCPQCMQDVIVLKFNPSTRQHFFGCNSCRYTLQAHRQKLLDDEKLDVDPREYGGVDLDTYDDMGPD